MRFLSILFAGVTLGSPVLACDAPYAPQASLNQAWPAQDRATWYGLSQGSRLVPIAWYNSLTLADGTADFAARTTQERYATRFCADSDLPVGFVIDSDPERGDALGLTCAACHTGTLTDGQHEFVVEGGASELNLQSYMSDLFQGLDTVFRDGGTTPGPRWTAFANGVLGAGHSGEDAASLHADLRHWLQQRHLVQKSIDAGGDWGHGRTDAVQVIVNTAAVLSGPRAGVDLPPATAPVSFPHVWNAPQMQRVQWNGSATKLVDVGIVETMELGAIVRNVAEVIGVFAEIELTTDRLGNTARYPSLESSVRLANLVRLERSLETLKSPAWPDEFGTPDPTMLGHGALVYLSECAECHSLLDRDDLQVTIHDAAPGGDVSTPVTRHIAAFDMANPGAPALNTDPSMACHVLTHTSWSGKFTRLHNSFAAFQKLWGDKTLSGLKPQQFDRDTITLRLIEELAMRLIYEKSGELVALQGEDMERAAAAFFRGLIAGDFGTDPRPGIDPAGDPDVPRPGTHTLTSVKEIRARCAEFLADTDTIPEYKARPLNGIFASPPYLHNGSVPTLYDLLLPTDQRPRSFAVGATYYDTEKLGLGAARPGPSGQFDVTQPGNFNGGHLYGISLRDADRAALLEYLKTL